MKNKRKNPKSIANLSEFRGWAEEESDRLCLGQLTAKGMGLKEAKAYIQEHGKIFTWIDFIKVILEAERNKS